MNRSRKDVVLMFVVGALLLFASYNFLLKPQRRDLSATRGDIEVVEQNVADAERVLQRPPTTVDATSELPSSAITRDPEMATLFRQLQASADVSGVSLTAVGPSTLDVNPNGPGGSMLISITATGTHDGVLTFLQQLRDMERLVVTEQIGIDSQVDQTSQVQISARVFTLQGPVTEAPATTPATPTSQP